MDHYLDTDPTEPPPAPPRPQASSGVRVRVIGGWLAIVTLLVQVLAVALGVACYAKLCEINHEVIRRAG